MYMEGKTAAITNIAEVVGGEYDTQADELYAWFIRTDGSFWRFGFRSGTLTEMHTSPTEPSEVSVPTDSTDTSEPQLVRGDTDGDGSFTLIDLVLFQKWLLCIPDAKLANPQAADLSGDAALDVFDLGLMKRELTEK